MAQMAPAVSKEVYDRILVAQQYVNENRLPEALAELDALLQIRLTEYELSNVLNYKGFVHYNMGDYERTVETYEAMLAIPSVEQQMRVQTT